MPFRLGVTVALLSLAGAGAGTARAADYPVTASGTSFTPPTLTITQGDRVIWTRTGGTHNVTFTSGPAFDMPADPSSSWTTVQRTFDAVGTFTYVCEAHAGLGMTGSVTVNAAPPTNPPPTNPPPGDPGPVDPGPGDPEPELPLLKVTLKVSDRTPLAGARIRLSGVVRPARDGRKVQIQRRGPGGAYKTIATTRLRDAGASRSVFSVRLALKGDAVLRARVAGDDERGAGVSRTRPIDVRPAR